MSETSHCFECGAQLSLSEHGDVCHACKEWDRQEQAKFEAECQHQGGTFVSNGRELCSHCLKDFGPEQWPYDYIEF